jgi:hypothetical protein
MNTEQFLALRISLTDVAKLTQEIDKEKSKRFYRSKEVDLQRLVTIIED